MKKGWKLFWIICAVTGSVGIICCMTAAILGVHTSDLENIFVFHLDDGDDVAHGIHEDHEYEYGESAKETDMKETYFGIEKIEVDASGIQLQVLPSDDGDVHVEAAGIDSRLKYRCWQEGAELKISTTHKLRVINRIDGYATVWLYLPARQLQEIELSNEAGEIYVEQAHARELAVKVGAGTARIDDFTVSEADFDCGAGEITAEGQILGDGDISCGVGEIMLMLAGREEDFSYEVDCGIGSVVIGDREFSGLGMDRSEQNPGGRELDIECGIGSVTVGFKG